VAFDVDAESYDRFMGGWSRLLAPRLLDLADVRVGQRALDVGCGPGALTAELVARLGARAVAAVDPSEPFVAAARARHPGVDVRQASAEALPFPDRTFDAACAQLVIHFMTDPVAGLREMARVTRMGGVVAASVWDFAGGRGPLGPFWESAREIDPDVEDESGRAGARADHLGELFAAAGLDRIETTSMAVRRPYATFDEWWEPFTRGVGPAGAFHSRLAPADRQRLRERCQSRLPDGPFELTAHAWVALGVVKRVRA
jgi:SAM-dependent methyltransferase